jgi:hypothetical protein
MARRVSLRMLCGTQINIAPYLLVCAEKKSLLGGVGGRSPTRKQQGAMTVHTMPNTSTAFLGPPTSGLTSCPIAAASSH